MSNATITRAQALSNAIAACTYIKDLEIEESKSVDWAETVSVLNKMREQISKPRAKTESKAHVMNKNLATKVAEKASVGATITTKDVVNFGIPEILTTQKATAVLRVACEMGLVEKSVEKKKVFFKVIKTA